MKKKDVNHLNRSELIDLVYQMDKSNTGLNTSVSEQIKQERRKIRQKNWNFGFDGYFCITRY